MALTKGDEMMTPTMLGRTVAAVFAGLLVAGAASAADMTGYVSDSQCAMSRATEKRAMDWILADKFETCVKKCAKEGSPLVFVTEDNKILKIDAASLKTVVPHAGQHVKVSGDVTGDTIRIASMSTIAMSAK